MNANEFGEKIKTRECQSCKHYVAQIANQIDEKFHNFVYLHELCMSMDVWVGEKRLNPVNLKFSLQTLWGSDFTSDW